MGFLTSVIRAATPENPRFSLNDPMAWETFLGGTPSSAGLRINREIALGFSPWWRGLTLLARDCGKLPLYVYRRQGDGKERATDHPAYYALRRKPNRYQTALAFRAQLTGHAAGGGNGYAFINRLGSGQFDPDDPLLPLDPDLTYPVRADGRLHYVTSVGTDTRKLLPEDVLHIPGFSYDGITGISVVEKARESLGLGIAGQRYQATYLKNGGRPAIILEHPAKLQPETAKTLRESWERMHTGLDNAHRTAILDGGMTAKTLAFSQVDAQFLETQKMTVRDIANYLGIPPHKLGDDGRTAYASLEQENQSYLDDGLDYWLSVWEHSCWDKLLTEDEKRDDTHFVQFQRSEIVRADLAGQAAFYRVALAGQPWMTVNEVRSRMDDLNPSEDEGTDEIKAPLNMGKGGGPDNQPENPNDTPPGRPKKAEAHRTLILDAAARAARRLGQHAIRAAGKPKEFSLWLWGIDQENHPSMLAILTPAVHAANAFTGHVHDPATVAASTIGCLREHLREMVDDTPVSGLAAAVERIVAEFERDWPSELAGWWFPEEH